MIISDVFTQYSTSNGKVAAVLFRINNSTDSAVVWTPNFYYTAYASWNEVASVTLNGDDSWNNGASGTKTDLTLYLPISRA